MKPENQPTPKLTQAELFDPVAEIIALKKRVAILESIVASLDRRTKGSIQYGL